MLLSLSIACFSFLPQASPQQASAAAPQNASAAAPQNASAAAPLGLEYWSGESHATRLAHDEAVVQAIDPASLSSWHDLVASEPHSAGSEGDERLIASLASAFEGMGLEVQVHPFTTYLSRPVSAELEIVSPAQVTLSLTEGVLPGDPFSEDLDDADAALLRLGWNAYSGSGDVTGEVVYANYGRLEDFQKLRDLGVDCTGKIVMTRYGGNFRGYKAKYAEAAGAAGLIIFTDPADSGYGRGLEAPEGGWANCNQIQRGSLKTLLYSGDPLTPGREATADAERLDPAEVALPKIPVQPVGWLAATQIMAPMDGPSVPGDWQGGMPFRYRLTGGQDLRVRLAVEQKRELIETANVIATLRGTDSKPEDPGLIVGCHHDAWIYGASDPTSGLIGVLEAARVLTEQYKIRDEPPARTITFAAWGAEEHGVIGSTEWVEGNRMRIIRGGTLYVNLDAAASGLRLGVSASPSLTRLLAGAAARVPQPVVDAKGEVTYEGTALDAWLARTPGEALPRVGFLGGGSDHVSFLALCSLPSASISAGGAPGTAYHSLYDDLDWYRRVVGPDYESAALVTRVTAVAVDRAACAPLPPVDLAAPAAALARAAEALAKSHPTVFQETASLGPLIAHAEAQVKRAERVQSGLEASLAKADDRDATWRAEAEAVLRRMERDWLREAGLPGRPWYRNLYAAPDETSGYAAWPLPGLQKAALEGDQDLAAGQAAQLEDVLLRREARLEQLMRLLRGDESAVESSGQK
ncbi:Peptidase family M28 [Planctomycetes bacterium Poly30]|uniref:Peptidase family M28 n=1 Tax=Saltatorellus ferox TaxID=2528018 RepID=A0A518ERG7_9BACT|nr:Peptidase family M28 [Planctomycetes bacterium Poly30]